MNAGRLLALYGRIVDAPDSIARLRRFVLDLAVRGKLVPQHAGDEPASELLKRIAKAKPRLVRAGEISKTSALAPVIEAEALPDLPPTWTWVQVGDIFDYDAGEKCDPKNLDSSQWLLELEDIEKDTSKIIQRLRVIDRDPQSTKSAFLPDDILYGKLRPYLNKVVVANEPGYSTTEIVAIRPFLRLCPEYCALAFRRPSFVAYVERLGRGTKMPRLRTPDAIIASFPLPPLAEQYRIAAKVNELMGLCDRLEAARAGREAVRDRLAAASLARLGAPDPETFQADARFALDALPALTARPDQIKALRHTILNLAVRGKIAPRNAGDEPASDLLVRIAREVADYTKANRIGQAQPDPITDRDLPFAAPDGWRWTRLSSLFKVITDGDHQPPPKVDEGVAFLTIGNITTGQLDFSGCRRVPETYFKLLAAYRTPAKGDILYTVVGATYGRPALVETDRAFCVQRHIAILKPVAAMSLGYLLTLLASPLIYDQATRSTTGTAQPTIALRPLRNFLVPLPPLAEQHRIVAKVDTLMALCDRLEAALTAADSARARLLDAVLAEALSSADDGSEAITVEPSTAAASPGAAVTTERSAFVLSLAYERHRFARRDKTFGHVKAEKILHLVEAEAGLDLGRAPFRDAAGPNDFHHLLGVDRWAKQHRRYAFDQKGKGYTFERLADFQTSLDVANTIDAPTRARIEKIVDLFVPMDKQDAELFATLYAAWNNLLIEGKSPDDADILRAAREDWHPDKLKIPRDRFVAALRDLKASEFVPSGRGKFVPAAPQRDLFPRQ